MCDRIEDDDSVYSKKRLLPRRTKGFMPFAPSACVVRVQSVTRNTPGRERTFCLGVFDRFYPHFSHDDIRREHASLPLNLDDRGPI